METDIIYCSKDKYNFVYLEKNEDGSYVAKEQKKFSYKHYENKPVVVYNTETGSFYGICSNYKEEGMDRTFFNLFRLSDFRLYNLEFGVSKNPVGDAQIYSCMLGVYKELIDDYDAEATAMFDYYINGDNYIEENKEELYRYINKLDDKYYVGSESYVCYEKSDEALSLYVTNVKDWDSAIIEKIYNKIIKIRDEWLYDTGSISTIYENDFNSRFPDNDNTKITVKDLAEYVSRKYFWNLYDYE